MFKNKMVKSKESWFDFNNLTLGNIISNKKNILFCVDKSLVNKELNNVDDVQFYKTVLEKNNVDDSGYVALRQLSEKIGFFDAKTIFSEQSYNSNDSPQTLKRIKLDQDLIKQINLMQFN